MRVPARKIPRFLYADGRIVICFCVVRGKVASLAEKRRKSLEPRRNFPLRPHMLGRSMPGGIHSGDEREAGSSANRFGETPLKNYPFTCQFIESGRASHLVPVTAQERV